MPGADCPLDRQPHTFCAGGQDDRGNADQLCVVVGDHIADNGFVALFLHIIKQTVGILPVFRGKGKNIQLDLQKIAEIFGNGGQGLEAQQSKFGSGVLGHFDTAQNIVVADADIDDRNVDGL